MTANVIGDMFPLGLRGGLFLQGCQSRSTHDLGIQPIRITGVAAVAAVVELAREMEGYQLVYYHRVSQWAVTSETHNMGRTVGLGRQIETQQHIVKRTAETGDIQPLAQLGNGAIFRLIAGGNQQLVQELTLLQPFNLPCQHGFAQQFL